MAEDLNDLAGLQETFAILGERIDLALPDSGREAFDAWRDLAGFIATTNKPIPQSAVDHAQKLFEEVILCLQQTHKTLP